MKKVMFALAILLCLLELANFRAVAGKSAHVDAAPSSSSGMIDLTGWDFAHDGIVRLDGQWELYWRQLLAPSDFARGMAPRTPSFVAVPGIWSDYLIAGEKLSNQGYATYRLVVLLDQTAADRPISLYMPSVATAYKLWINGEAAAQNGTVGANREQMTPRNVARVVPIRASDTTLEIVLQVSNFVQRKGGVWQSIRLGYADQIDRRYELNLISSLGFFIGLFVMGIYHLFLFFPRRSDRSPLYFALLCFAVGIRALFVKDTLAVHLFPAIPWETATKLEYLSANFAMVFLLLFVYRQFPQDMRKMARNALLVFEGVFIGFVAVTPAIVYTKAMIVQETLIVLDLSVILYVFVVAIWRKREGSLINLCGLLFIIVAVLNDIFMYSRMIESVDLSPLGLFAYLFAQSVILSRKFARSFTKVENLSSELRQINLTLEEKIEERTSALRHANKSLREVNGRLEQMEDSRRRLLFNITHEMGNPLTSLQGYLQAFEDGLVREETTPKYFGMMRKKIRYLDQMIQDLVELTRLETRQILFQFHLVHVRPLIRQLCEKYEWDVTHKAIRFEFAQAKSGQSDAVRADLALLDPVRVEQVFVNLLFNAVKFTPSGGAIAVTCATGAGASGMAGDYVTVTIRDTGAGIPEDELPHIFERFYKGRAQFPEEEGGGLGLSIAKEIVEKHGGVIGVESKPGKGSAFYFRLPVHKAAAADETPESDKGDQADG